MKRTRLGLLAAGLAALVVSGAALAQNPPTPPPGRGAPTQPRPGIQPGPGGRPVIIGPDGRPMPAPGGRGMPVPGGRNPVPGGRPGGRPLPPGFNPRGATPPPAAHHEEEAAHHECPGHGHADPPPHVNWWQGLLMVDNERAEAPGFVNKLLFRYENHKNPCDPKNMPPPFLASVLNFGLFAFVIYRFGKKPLGDALVKRKQTIMAEIDTATKLKEDAEGRLQGYEEKLENLEETLTAMRAEHAAQAEAEKKHLLSEAEERRVRMRRDAEFRIEQELKAARAVLLEEAVEGAVAAAREVLAKRTTPADLDRMAEDYLGSVGAAIASVKKPGALTTSSETRGGAA
jgi:F-type H+-transporting ATPase subunit b